jgi:hypothetical protein
MIEEYKNEKGEYHRKDGPALIAGDYKIWYINGEKHCEDGPAFIRGNKKVWYINDERHREDGPAYIKGDHKEWWINGELHREDGPAYIKGDHKEWWINGKLHHEDGPAIIKGDKQEWYINDIERDKKWVDKYLKIKNKHMIDGVIVSDYWKILEIILRWRYNPNLKCVQNRLIREYNQIDFYLSER